MHASTHWFCLVCIRQAQTGQFYWVQDCIVQGVTGEIEVVGTDCSSAYSGVVRGAGAAGPTTWSAASESRFVLVRSFNFNASCKTERSSFNICTLAHSCRLCTAWKMMVGHGPEEQLQRTNNILVLCL